MLNRILHDHTTIVHRSYENTILYENGLQINLRNLYGPFLWHKRYKQGDKSQFMNFYVTLLM
jgi:hypothetical protein